jgi:hypothetical protein
VGLSLVAAAGRDEQLTALAGELTSISDFFG